MGLKRRLPRSRRLRRNGAKGLFAAVAKAAKRQEGTLASERTSSFLQIVSLGLMGVGKSTLMRALAWILHGIWVNQDEFTHMKKNAKHGFLTRLQELSSSTDVAPALLVDKINTLRSHRREILEALCVNSSKGTKWKRVLLRCFHPADQPSKISRATVQLALSRIASRGKAHRSLRSDEKRLKGILHGTANAYEALSPEELAFFDAVIDVDVTASPEQMLRSVLQHLESCGLVSLVQGDQLLQTALSISLRHEEHLGGQSSKVSGSSMVRSLSRPLVGDRLPLYWGISFDSSHAVQQLFQVPEAWKSVDCPHVTLLYIGGQAASQDSQLQRQSAAIAATAGRRVEVLLHKVLSNEHAACVLARLPSDIPFHGLSKPHITLGHSRDVGPVYSNTLILQCNSPALACKSRAIQPELRIEGTISAVWGRSRH